MHEQFVSFRNWAREQIRDLNSKVNSLPAQSEDPTSKISELEAKLAKLGSELKDLHGQVGKLETSYKELQKKIESSGKNSSKKEASSPIAG